MVCVNHSEHPLASQNSFIIASAAHHGKVEYLQQVFAFRFIQVPSSQPEIQMCLINLNLNLLKQLPVAPCWL